MLTIGTHDRLLGCSLSAVKDPVSQFTQIVPFKLGGRPEWDRKEYKFENKNRQHFSANAGLHWTLNLLKAPCKSDQTHWRELALSNVDDAEFVGDLALAGGVCGLPLPGCPHGR